MTRQLVDNILLGAPTLVFDDTWQHIQDKEYQQGREIGHCASIIRVQRGKYRDRASWLDKNGDIWVSTKPAEAHGDPH